MWIVTWCPWRSRRLTGLRMLKPPLYLPPSHPLHQQSAHHTTSRTFIWKTKIPGADSVDTINASTHAFDPNTIVFNTLQTGRYMKSPSHLASVTTTTALVFTHRTHHHLILHTPCQLTSLRWFATHRGSPPWSQPSAPHPTFATTRRHPPFNLSRPPTTLRRWEPPTDTPQDSHHWSFTLCLPFSAAVAPCYRFVRNSAPSGVLPHLVSGSHTHFGTLGDVFNRRCDWDGCIWGGGTCNREKWVREWGGRGVPGVLA